MSDPYRDYDYDIRHAIYLDGCKRIIADWRMLMEGQNEVCLLGVPIEYLKGIPPSKYRDWTWDQLLTAKGCSSWFGRWCEKDGPTAPESPTLGAQSEGHT